MKEDWDDAITFVLKMEGGTTAENNPHDKGGLTKYGISKKAYPSLDIENLTLDDAKEIYRNDYWKACSCDDLPRPFAIATFDCGVNQGTGRAKRIMQMALGVTVDGVVGPKTIEAAHKAEPWRVRLMLAERCAAYARIMVDDKNNLYWAVNWYKRVLNLSQIVLPRESNA